MRELSRLSRRGFGQGLGLALVLAGPAEGALAAEGEPVAQVMIRRFNFEPALVTIRAGDSVEWINADLAPHTATGLADDWDTGSMARNASSRIRFDVEGRYSYRCVFHPNMTGEVLVIARDEN
ncbi:cupredoxin family copper-binding protein [uncultured Maricaulis sp.]|uniref:cupredoxin domain-containing protein n=1 Tax=uncultured Maricaulis sp. TaxID=174710 RepID=UPI0030D7B6B1|tara:strand:- start:1965 stop:2333 length:369 start_codon:yes stop_codon:yes gene_type:complete